MKLIVIGLGAMALIALIVIHMNPPHLHGSRALFINQYGHETEHAR